jgi:ketosteroid isomerase-like protein
VTYLRGEIRGRPDFRLLATAGDRRALLHAAWQETLGDAPFAIDIYSVVDADAAGRLRAIVLFGTEDRAAAHAELFERWAASDADGPPAASVAFLRAVNAHDLVAVRAALCDDFVYDDRRLVGLGRLAGADAYLPSLSAFFGLSADARIDMLYEVARAPHGHVTVCRTWGTNAEGGDFETPFVMLLHFRGGLVAGLERFELEELGAALARLDALRPDPLRIPDNAATRAGMEFARAAYARDWEAVRDLCAPDFVFEDRGKRALVTGGVEAWIASVEYTTTLPGVRIETPRVTALGERICVQAIRWGSTEGAFEFGRLRLLEVDSEGRVRATLFFDPEDRFAASNEALARFAAGEAAGARGVEAFAAWRLASASRDVEGVERLLAPAFEYVDHRRLGLGTLSAAEWVASCRVVAELSPDAAIETLRILAWNAHGVLLATRSFGSVPNGGGPFENLMLVACVAGPAGIEHFELFEIDDVERARARFEALAAGGAG